MLTQWQHNALSCPACGGLPELLRRAIITDERSQISDLLLEFLESERVSGIVGRIVNVKAEEAVLSENGKVDPIKLSALMFDQFQHGYYKTGEKAGMAWNAGVKLMKGES